MQFPSNCKYTEDHEWVRLESGNTAYVGITDFAQGEPAPNGYVVSFDTPVGVRCNPVNAPANCATPTE